MAAARARLAALDRAREDLRAARDDECRTRLLEDLVVRFTPQQETT